MLEHHARMNSWKMDPAGWHRPRRCHIENEVGAGSRLDSYHATFAIQSRTLTFHTTQIVRLFARKGSDRWHCLLLISAPLCLRSYNTATGLAVLGFMVSGKAIQGTLSLFLYPLS